MILLLCVLTFFIATGGILYELVLGTLGSYLFGGTERVFSLTAGVYMFSMGLGALVASLFRVHPLKALLRVEWALVVLHVGGPFLIWQAYTSGLAAGLTFWSVLVASGTLVGTEIPLVLATARLLNPQKERAETKRVSQILAADYFGALAASLAFGFWGLSQLGLLGTAAFAALTEAVGAVLLVWFAKRHAVQEQGSLKVSFVVSVLIAGLALLFLWKAEALQERLEGTRAAAILPGSRVVHSEWSGLQQITLIQAAHATGNAHWLYLDGQAQWSTGGDLEAFHEMLVLPAVESYTASTGKPVQRALVLGGGDGFSADGLVEKYRVPAVTIVEIDRRIAELARRFSFWHERGGKALDHKSVEIVYQDAFEFVRNAKQGAPYEVILFDLPVPRNASVARLYSVFFLRQIKEILAPRGVIALMSPDQGRESDVRCTLLETLKRVGFQWRAFVHQGQGTFLIASQSPLSLPAADQPWPGNLLQHAGDLVETRSSRKCRANSLLRPTLVR